MAARIPQHVREEQIRSLCEGTLYSFVKWEGEYKNCNSKFVCDCRLHGQWAPSVGNFIHHGKRCSKCANNFTISENERRYQIEKECKNTIYSFVGWEGEYINAFSPMLCKCQKHGNWLTSPDRFVRGGHRCPGCRSEGNRIDKEKRKQEILNICKNTIYSFVGWEGEYRNNLDKFTCSCEIHGEWIVSVNNFINQGARCPGCAERGFNQFAEGSLYCLRSNCGCFVKIGISNNYKIRMKSLERSTPFEFLLIEIIHGNGREMRFLEKLFHDNFESAAFTGFGGATEWLKWNPEIPLWFKFLNG